MKCIIFKKSIFTNKLLQKTSLGSNKCTLGQQKESIVIMDGDW